MQDNNNILAILQTVQMTHTSLHRLPVCSYDINYYYCTNTKSTCTPTLPGMCTMLKYEGTLIYKTQDRLPSCMAHYITNTNHTTTRPETGYQYLYHTTAQMTHTYKTRAQVTIMCGTVQYKYKEHT